MNRFQKIFADPQRRILLPFFTLGDPNPQVSLDIITSAVKAGADGLELGIAFSDPIADGPTNQRSMMRALNAGMRFDRALEMLRALRQRFPTLPIGLLVYYNLLHRRGLNKAIADLTLAGVDAIVSADCPLEESGPLEAALAKHGMGAIQMIAPNTPDARAMLLFERSSAFTYVLSGFGTTGVKDQLDPRTVARVEHLRQLSNHPMVVGFGISKPEQVHAIWQAGANGAIVGSCFTQIIEQHLQQPDVAKQQIEQFIQQVQTC
jgi:tryptophan synthase alpha chain